MLVIEPRWTSCKCTYCSPFSPLLLKPCNTCFLLYRLLIVNRVRCFGSNEPWWTYKAQERKNLADFGIAHSKWPLLKWATYNEASMITYGMDVPRKTSTGTSKASNVNHMQTTLTAGCQSFLNWMVFRVSHWPQVAKGDCMRLYKSRSLFYMTPNNVVWSLYCLAMKWNPLVK